MVKGIAYKEYNNIYDIACGMKGNEGILLSPNRAIFSALCGVLTLEDLSNRKRILGKDVYDYSCDCFDEIEMNSNDFSAYFDVFPEAKGMIYTSDRIPFQEWDINHKEDYIRQILNSNWSFQYLHRFVAAKVRREYFPATKEFIERHYLEEDVGAGLVKIITEELNNKNLSLF